MQCYFFKKSNIMCCSLSFFTNVNTYSIALNNCNIKKTNRKFYKLKTYN